MVQTSTKSRISSVADETNVATSVWYFQVILFIYTLKALLSPRGAYLILDLPEGGLNREGGLFTKSSEKDIFGSFSVPLFHILRIQHTIFRFKYTDSTQFFPISY